jgi:2,3-dihydroxy-p-cumate/2,3-dihydroxybenzoate 3,4-dioxygenase
MSPASVTDLRFVGLAVPDLQAERHFFGTLWGLTEAAEADGMVYFAAAGSPHHHVIRIRPNAVGMTDVIGFSAASRADVDSLAGQAVSAGGTLIHSPRPLAGPGGGYGFRFFDPDGHAIEVAAEVAERKPRDLHKGDSIPIGLSHIVLHSPQVAGLAAFYQHGLGLRVSDWIADFMCFMRCNPAHHRFAILPGAPALNHIAFDMLSVDEMMRGLARMIRSKVPLTWGPGRHTAGDNTFSYFMTPNGNQVEYTSDLELVDEATWVPRIYPFTPEITDQWGTGQITGDRPHHALPADAGLWQVPA